VKRNPDPWEEWVKTRPKVVQDLARKYPFGSHFHVKETIYYLLGYNENGMLIVSTTDPKKDYDLAIATKELIHEEHVETHQNEVGGNPPTAPQHPEVTHRQNQ